MQNTAIPRVDLSEFIRERPPIHILEPYPVDGNISLFEMETLATLVRYFRPRNVFEIGTFDGRTTLNLACNSPQDAKVYTLDLPQDLVNRTRLPLDVEDRKYVQKRISGLRYMGTEHEEKIVQLYGDSAAYDFSPFSGNMDLVFIDGSHSYEYVLHDSKLALELLKRDEGVILWHDYGNPCWEGLTTALNELFTRFSAFHNMKRIKGTTLACLIRSQDA